MFLISPNRTFRGALPERYGQGEPTFETVFKEAKIGHESIGNTLHNSQNSAQNFFSVQSGAVSFEAPKAQEYTINVYGLNGQRVRSISVSATSANEKNTILKAGSLTGAYIFEVDLGSSVHRSLQKLF